MLNMNFTKDLVLCEIIERHEGKSIIVVVTFFLLSDYHTECHSFDCHGVCMNQCEIPIITLLIPITYIGHFFHLNSDC